MEIPRLARLVQAVQVPAFGALYRLDAEEMNIHDRLRNWGIAMRVVIPSGHCASIEHLWRPNWRQWMFPHEIPITNPIDHLDAWEVEEAWRECDRRTKTVLSLHYIKKCSPIQIADRIRKPRVEFSYHLFKAQQNIAGVLTLPNEIWYGQSRNAITDPPASAVDTSKTPSGSLGVAKKE